MKSEKTELKKYEIRKVSVVIASDIRRIFVASLSPWCKGIWKEEREYPNSKKGRIDNFHGAMKWIKIASLWTPGRTPDVVSYKRFSYTKFCTLKYDYSIKQKPQNEFATFQ